MHAGLVEHTKRSLNFAEKPRTPSPPPIPSPEDDEHRKPKTRSASKFRSPGTMNALNAAIPPGSDERDDDDGVGEAQQGTPTNKEKRKVRIYIELFEYKIS